ncbi:MAG TPA: SpoIIE family protein phosphatase [Solirubrobacteraceae bacterium]|jgi:serine phosphatase RsbU (regulator of sigma subunit)/anti-sigma regulatory factor (Ser/Thr protein kinase)|nr:SpoIIE family protein phosphatase [Solirubrobacteraceae bacterium]
MTVFEPTIRRIVRRRARLLSGGVSRSLPPTPTPRSKVAGGAPPIKIAPHDPIIAHCQDAVGAIELEHLNLDSPALAEMRTSGVTLVVPLVTNGELIGMLSVGRRLSDQDYSADDRRVLESLAAHAAPAVRVGQLIREQRAEIRARGVLEQELAVARLIQQNFLPKQLPELAGWQIAAYYRPAHAVGGDFYDFIELPRGRIGLVIGDVTDKGIPAAMVMAATRSVLRASAQRLLDPGAVLAAVNDNLCPDIPEHMFVTCFYGILEPANGHLRYANAGHNLPLMRSGAKRSELRATGMPLGLMPGTDYEERDATLDLRSRVLFYSDGLIEAHGSRNEMFGTRRAFEVLARALDAQPLIDELLHALDAFTGDESEQEDDITLVVVQRSAATHAAAVLADFAVASAPGNERDATRRVAQALASCDLPAGGLERLKTATGEATMNAMEHGNDYDPGLDVRIVVAASASEVTVRITDHGGDREIAAVHTPDIAAKLDGRQSPRGWGLFLIERMVDAVRHESDATHHTVELEMHLEGGEHATGGT